MTTTRKQGRCYHPFRTVPTTGHDDVQRCTTCDCLPVGRDEETDEPYCDCCVKQA